MSNLPKCQTCLNFLVFSTDWIGRVQWMHPEVRCIAPPPVVYQPEEEVESVIKLRECVVCHNNFRPNKRGAHKVCSTKCRYARVEQLRSERKEARGIQWRLEVLNKLDLPTKTCGQCGRLFTQTSKLSGKQFLCSLACRKQRERDKAKERAA